MGNSPSSMQPRPGVTGAYQPSYQYPQGGPPPQQQQPHNAYQPQGFQQGYNNGSYYGNFASYPPGPSYQAPYAPGQFGQPPPPRAPPNAPAAHATYPQPQPQEFQPAATIRNQVNLRKNSIKVQPLPENPSQFAITFSFDATAPCRASVFVNAKDDKHNKVLSKEAPLAVVRYEKGIDQRFPASGMAPKAISAACIKEWSHMADDRFSIVIRLEALTDEGRAEGKSLDSVQPGAALPTWVQSQTTYARMHRSDDGTCWTASNVTQKLWVNGTVFELQEIYGMEAGRPVEVVDGMEDGNECVICMSAQRDTTALPCRHMCMCHTCANELKTQTNKCPICRNVISSLLHIKIASHAAGPQGGAAAAAGRAVAAGSSAAPVPAQPVQLPVAGPVTK